MSPKQFHIRSIQHVDRKWKGMYLAQNGLYTGPGKNLELERIEVDYALIGQREKGGFKDIDLIGLFRNFSSPSGDEIPRKRLKSQRGKLKGNVYLHKVNVEHLSEKD